MVRSLVGTKRVQIARATALANGIPLRMAASGLLGVAVAGFLMFDNSEFDRSHFGEFVDVLVGFGLGGAVAGLIGALVVGIPVTVALAKIGSNDWFMAMPIGVSVGFLLGQGFDSRRDPGIFIEVVCTLYGGVCALAFWFGARFYSIPTDGLKTTEKF